MCKLLSVFPFFHAHVDIWNPLPLHKLIVEFSFMCKSVWCSQSTFYLKLTYLTLLVVKKIHVTTQTQNFSLYYVAMDIVAKGEWSSNCSYRCYFYIFFSALLMLFCILSLQKHIDNSRVSKTCIHWHSIFFSIDPSFRWLTITFSVCYFLQLCLFSQINFRLLIAAIKVVYY